ncbi:hypothetical protein F0562_003098 [Nyssa sinensis]|uniref:Uncharacterized protein n=1 Tax=Nyssa sinensis TaxID=561372 RepID=A0A5J5BZE6_9ASTE|nr:hypothetical protein F0562_003098 [Nyssa sinensis]
MGTKLAKMKELQMLCVTPSEHHEKFDQETSIGEVSIEPPFEYLELAIELSQTLSYDCGSPAAVQHLAAALKTKHVPKSTNISTSLVPLGSEPKCHSLICLQAVGLAIDAYCDVPGSNEKMVVEGTVVPSSPSTTTCSLNFEDEDFNVEELEESDTGDLLGLSSDDEELNDKIGEHATNKTNEGFMGGVNLEQHSGDKLSSYGSTDDEAGYNQAVMIPLWLNLVPSLRCLMILLMGRSTMLRLKRK